MFVPVKNRSKYHCKFWQHSKGQIDKTLASKLTGHIHDCLQDISNILDTSLKHNNFSFVLRRAVTRQKGLLSALDGLDQSISGDWVRAVAHRWACSNVHQPAPVWMYGQQAEAHNYLWIWLHSCHDLNWRCLCSIKNGEPFVCWENTRTFTTTCCKMSRNRSEQEKHWCIKSVLGMCPPTFMWSFPLRINHTHTRDPQSTALILVLHFGASSQLQFIHYKWTMSITQMQPRGSAG